MFVDIGGLIFVAVAAAAGVGSGVDTGGGNSVTTKDKT